MDYHLAGWLSAIFVTLSTSGIALQLRTVLRRKRQCKQGLLPAGEVTSILSLNRFFASFYGFYAMLLYGMCLTEFNHYLVWPRVVAVAILTWLLLEIRNDRRSRPAVLIFMLVVLLDVAALALPLTEWRVAVHEAWVSKAILMSALIVFVQGASHQVLMIRRSGTTGALSLPMHVLFLVKDIASVAFALGMGWQNGWPVLLFHGGSAFFQCLVIYHFHWCGNLWPNQQAKNAQQPRETDS